MFVAAKRRYVEEVRQWSKPRTLQGPPWCVRLWCWLADLLHGSVGKTRRSVIRAGYHGPCTWKQLADAAVRRGIRIVICQSKYTLSRRHVNKQMRSSTDVALYEPKSMAYRPKLKSNSTIRRILFCMCGLVWRLGKDITQRYKPHTAAATALLCQRRAVQVRAHRIWPATKQPYAALVCHLMVSIPVIHVITWITTRLRTPEGWKAEFTCTM